MAILDLTSHQLDHVLEQYYLKTETPTMEYIHSLCALSITNTLRSTTNPRMYKFGAITPKKLPNYWNLI